ncbi:MAG: hypothetical protein Q9159_007724 [Coniocarpon cinnabarinum]
MRRLLAAQVFRYSALAGGVVYGFMHQRSLNSAGEAAQEKHDYDHKQHQIESAKRAWQDRVNPPKTDGVISDPESPQFDFEKWINHQAKS